jgi:hypothetical protein
MGYNVSLVDAIQVIFLSWLMPLRQKVRLFV